MSDEYIQQEIMKAGAANFASQEVEESVIFALVAGGDDTASLTDKVSEGDFYFAEHAKIFRAIKATVAKQLKVDLITVDATIGEMFPQEQAGLSNVMIGCINSHVISRNADDYIAIMQELSARRSSIKSLEEIAAQLRDPTQDMGEILEKLRNESQAVVGSKHKWESMVDVLLNTYEYLENRVKGETKSITTGIPNVDALVGGFFGGELTVIGARPSVGKSAFGANIAVEAAQKGFKVAVVSREMTDIQFGQRLISRETMIDGMKLRKAAIEVDDWETIAESISHMSHLPISFLFSVRTVEDLRREVQAKVSKGELDMLVVDYLQLMHTSRRFKEEHLRVGYISKSLKDIAVDFNIPVIALAQVNRDTDGQMPTLKSLKASGDIEQDADGVIFLHRPTDANDQYIDPRDREYFQTYASNELTYICIGVAKQRQGAIGKACVLFDAAHMRYFQIDRGSEEQ